SLVYDPSDPQAGIVPDVPAAAYSNNVAGATQTTLYVWDYNTDTLARVGSIGGTPVSPNTGLTFTINNPTPVLLTFNAGMGMDISGASGTLFVTHDDPATGATANLYTRNLTTGAETLIGAYPAGTIVADISVAIAGGPTPTPTATPTATATSTATPTVTPTPLCTPSL